MFRLLETDIKEQKKSQKRIQTSVDNTINDLCYEIKFENRMIDSNFLLSETLLCFFKQKFLRKLYQHFFLLPRQILIRYPITEDMPRQKP